jgi:ectoine hydroxylase-related dioxygenase (phytanoyl-CoA dioxygenase family)
MDDQLEEVFGRTLPRRSSAADQVLVDRMWSEGWVVIENVLSAEQIVAARTAMLGLLGPVGRNPFEGTSTQRAYSLLAKTRAIDALVEHPAVLGLVDAFLDNALLSAALVVHLHPGEVAQPWHCDGQFYGVPRPRAPIGVSTVWALDDFTADNGATQLVTRSHLWGERRPERDIESLRAVMPAGSVLVFFDSLYHRAGGNRAAAPRCGLTIQYCQGWARGIENMVLAIPRKVVAGLSPRLQDLVGYSIHHAFVGYVDGRHPKKLLDRDV